MPDFEPAAKPYDVKAANFKSTVPPEPLYDDEKELLASFERGEHDTHEYDADGKIVPIKAR